MERRVLVILDYAHGSDVPGKCSPDGRFKEYRWSRKVGGMLKHELEREGFTVALTNSSDKEIGLSRRKEIANEINTPRCGIKLLVSLHNNAAGNGKDWGKARGFEIYTPKKQTRSDLFATIIFDQLQKDFPLELGYKHRFDKLDGDTDKEENFTVLMGRSYWAVLLEWLFQDNKQDLELLEDDRVNQKLVNSLVKSLRYIDENLDKIKI